MGGESESHHGGSLWVSFLVLLGQCQEVNAGFGEYGRQVRRGFRQRQYGIDQRLLGIRDQKVLEYESIS